MEVEFIDKLDQILLGIRYLLFMAGLLVGFSIAKLIDIWRG